MSEETRDVLEKAELMMQKGWLAGYERVTPELVEEIRRLRKAIRVLPCYLNPYGQTYECAVNKPCKACAARALLPTGDSDDQ